MSFLNKMKRLASETEAKERTAKDDQRQRRLNLIDAQCERIIESLQSDIEKDAHGERSWDGHVMGFIDYCLQDENGSHLKLEKYGDRINATDIEALPGFTKLKAYCEVLGVTMELHEGDAAGSLRVVMSIYIDGWK